MVNRGGRRRRLVAGLALVLAACASGGGDARSDDGAAGAETDAEQVATPGPPFAVGRRTLELVDASRPTDAVPGHPARPERAIEVQLVYPAAPTDGNGTTGTEPTDDDADGQEEVGTEPTDDDAGGEPTDDDGTAGTEPTDDDAGGQEEAGGGEPGSGRAAVVDAPPAQGRFPLVVLAHGVNGQGDTFVPYGELWAQEGYVVALPTFPLSRSGIGHSPDYANQPADVSFVIDEVLALGGDGDGDGEDPLAGRVDGERVAVAGHSLGSATVLGVGYNSCCVDERVDAVISVSGGGLLYEGGDYTDPRPTPLLLMHGARDGTVPVAAGDSTLDTLGGAGVPVHYVRFAEADHSNLFWGEDGELLNAASLAFLDAELRDEPDALDALAGTVEASGRAELRTSP
jgi:dienelactone hydrolase